jgi:hypothetical protein
MMGLGMPELLIFCVFVPLLVWLANWAFRKPQ